jgi:hypothetical protein
MRLFPQAEMYMQIDEQQHAQLVRTLRRVCGLPRREVEERLSDIVGALVHVLASKPVIVAQLLTDPRGRAGRAARGQSLPGIDPGATTPPSP